MIFFFRGVIEAVIFTGLSFVCLFVIVVLMKMSLLLLIVGFFFCHRFDTVSEDAVFAFFQTFLFSITFALIVFVCLFFSY